MKYKHPLLLVWPWIASCNADLGLDPRPEAGPCSLWPPPWLQSQSLAQSLRSLNGDYFSWTLLREPFRWTSELIPLYNSLDFDIREANSS